MTGIDDHDEGHARWAELLSGPEDAVALDEACLLISARLQPDAAVSVEAQRRCLDALATGVTDARLDGVVGHLFRSGDFRGNAQDYSDPANSYLDRVLERHVGIPISLTILAIEVGRRAGVALHGVGLPGHFLLGSGAEPDRFVDVFSGGIDLDTDACRRLFETSFGTAASFERSWLDPLPVHALLARVLANLKNSFTSRGELRPLAEVLRLRAFLPVVSAAERLELAEVQTALGRFPEAADCYEQVATVLEASGEEPDGDRVTALRSRAIAARARLN